MARRRRRRYRRSGRRVAGLAAGSIALIGFGADSLIEALAGGVVLWLFTGNRRGSHDAERRAQELIAASFFLLAAYVAVEELQVDRSGPPPTKLGRDRSRGLHSLDDAAARPRQATDEPAPLRRRREGILTDAAMRVPLISRFCSGLGANALAGWWWADPAAALVIAAVALKEGRASWRGQGCCDAC